MGSDTPVPFVKTSLAPYGRVPQSLLFHPDADDRAIRLFAVLDRHDGGRGIYPSRSRLAKLCHCSMKSIDRATVSLMALGYVEVATRHDDGNRQKSNFYTLHFEPKKAGGRDTPDPGEGDTRVAPQGDTRVAQNDSNIERSPNGVTPDKPASVPVATPPAPTKPARKSDPWLDAQFAKVKLISSTATSKDIHGLLGFLKKFHSPLAVIERALDRLVDQKQDLGVQVLWEHARAECRRQQVAKVATKQGGPQEVSASNSRRTNQ